LLCNEAHNKPTKFVTFTSESLEDSILLWYDVASFCKRRESSSPLQKPQNENILLYQLLPDNQILKSIITWAVMNIAVNLMFPLSMWDFLASLVTVGSSGMSLGVSSNA